MTKFWNDRHVSFIAEAGVNHNGSLARALDMVDAAAEAGADFVKFQTFRADTLASRTAPTAEYQKRQAGEDSQYAMLKALELDEEAFRALAERAGARGIGFLSTPFDVEDCRFLTATLGLDVIKLSSGDLTNPLLLLSAAQSGADVILSTGMADLAEVETALGVLAFGYGDGGTPSRAAFQAAWDSTAGQAAVRDKVCLLHCTTAYPTPLEQVNLRAMTSLDEAFGVDVGYSDHTLGDIAALGAVALGARVIEKHFTLDRSLPGPDHAASQTPEEMARLVANIRDMETALGRADKLATALEAQNMKAARKSLVALSTIAEGDAFTADSLGVKRPGDGMSPTLYWDLLGKKARRSYAPDDPILSDELD